VGARQVKGKSAADVRGRRPRVRVCLRKGCGRKYQPRRWNQRYCQEPECRREVRRWQAARRQAKRRQAAEARAQHAQAERARRERVKSVPQVDQNSEVAAARGHAAEDFFRFPCAIGRAATSRRPARSAIRPATVAGLAGRRFAMCKIGNASGGPAGLWKARRSAPTSTRLRVNGGLRKSRRSRRRVLRRSNAASRRAGRHLSSCSGRPATLGVLFTPRSPP
jgi:hypothetical protein